MATSEEVAEYGYQAMMRGDRIAIHGFLNRLGVFLTRFAPRVLQAKIVKKMIT
jgi:short-subunit dehydrogenase